AVRFFAPGKCRGLRLWMMNARRCFDERDAELVSIFGPCLTERRSKRARHFFRELLHRVVRRRRCSWIERGAFFTLRENQRSLGMHVKCFGRRCDEACVLRGERFGKDVRRHVTELGMCSNGFDGLFANAKLGTLRERTEDVFSLTADRASQER